MAATRICALDDVPEDDARSFEIEGRVSGRQPRSIIVARRSGEVFAYENRCPHIGVTLDIRPDRLLDTTGEYLICATHGALFRFEDGHCVIGPCAGDRLIAVKIEVVGGAVCLPSEGPLQSEKGSESGAD